MGGGSVRGGGWLGWGGHGGCERRIEVFVKIQKKMGASWGVRWGVRMDVNEELKFLWKFKKKLGGGGRVEGGQAGCERSIEVFVKIQFFFYFFFFFGGGGGGVRGWWGSGWGGGSGWM